MDQAMGKGVPNGYGNLDRSMDDISDDANYAASLMGGGSGGGNYSAFWSNVVSALMSGGDGSSWTNNGDGTNTYDFANDATNQSGINIYTDNSLTGNTTLVATINTTLISADICLPMPDVFTGANDGKPYTFDLDGILGKISTQMAKFKTDPDAIVIDMSFGGIAGDMGGIYGTELVIFRNGTSANSNVYRYDYSTGETDGFCIGFGMQVGFGSKNPNSNCGGNNPTPENYAAGSTSMSFYGVGYGGATVSRSNCNSVPNWFTVTAGTAWDGGLDLVGGVCGGTINVTSKGALFPCH